MHRCRLSGTASAHGPELNICFHKEPALPSGYKEIRPFSSNLRVFLDLGVVYRLQEPADEILEVIPRLLLIPAPSRDHFRLLRSSTAYQHRTNFTNGLIHHYPKTRQSGAWFRITISMLSLPIKYIPAPQPGRQSAGEPVRGWPRFQGRLPWSRPHDNPENAPQERGPLAGNAGRLLDIWFGATIILSDN